VLLWEESIKNEVRERKWWITNLVLHWIYQSNCYRPFCHMVNMPWNRIIHIHLTLCHPPYKKPYVCLSDIPEFLFETASFQSILGPTHPHPSFSNVDCQVVLLCTCIDHLQVAQSWGYFDSRNPGIQKTILKLRLPEPSRICCNYLPWIKVMNLILSYLRFFIPYPLSSSIE